MFNEDKGLITDEEIKSIESNSIFEPKDKEAEEVRSLTSGAAAGGAAGAGGGAAAGAAGK